MQGGLLASEGNCTATRRALTTHAPSTYKIPTAADVPAIFRVELMEGVPNRVETILSPKAVGEPPMLALSVYHAIPRRCCQSCAGEGVNCAGCVPATPEAVLAAIETLRPTHLAG